MILNSKSFFDYDLNEIVYDKISRKHTKLIGIEYKTGKIGSTANNTYMENVFYYVENNINDGKRDPWQIDKVDVSISEDVDDEYLDFFFRR